MITFSESLDKRLKLFSATNQNIEEVKGEMANQISESFLQNKNFFQKNAGKIYVVSGGFKECVLPVAEKLAIPPENVFANNFVYNASGGISGVDTDNYLAQEKGKIKQVEAINIANPRCVIGDGYTDFQIKEEGAADHFIAYTEHKRRDEVCGKADEEAKSFDEVLKALEEFGLVK